MREKDQAVNHRSAEDEHERLLRRIEQERDSLKRILEQMPIGVSLLAPTGSLVYSNAEGARLRGGPLPQIEGFKDFPRFGALHEDGTPYKFEEYPGVRSLVSGEVIRGEVIKRLRSDGTESFISLNSAPIRDSEGNVAFAVVTYMDITESKRIEEESEKLLRQEKTAREEAEAANRMKDEFLATLSHELRTPLTAIFGWACLLTSNSVPKRDIRHALEVIEQSAKSQARLVDDILDMSRIITGQLKLDARPVKIERVFIDAVDIVRPAATAKSIQLHVAVVDHGSIVFGDANRLQQAIWNLLSNAVKFTNLGGRIEAKLTRVEGQIQIVIQDNGTGIEPDFLPHVFERFRQADSTSTRRYGGLGLGLAITREVVEMHGGNVTAISAGKGLGSTFKLQFPVASPMQMLESEETAPNPFSAPNANDAVPREAA